MAIMVEKISALTFRVSNMKVSVQFYRDVLGMELLYGGETAGFSSLRAKYPESAILNLEEANTVTQWGRLIFYVADVDAVWRHLKERGFDPPQPQNASWGERYFHILDPDGHELSFACRLGQRHEHGEPQKATPRGRAQEKALGERTEGLGRLIPRKSLFPPAPRHQALSPPFAARSHAASSESLTCVRSL